MAQKGKNPWIGSDDYKATSRLMKRKDREQFEHEGGYYEGGQWVKRAGRKTQGRLGRTNPDNTKKVVRRKP